MNTKVVINKIICKQNKLCSAKEAFNKIAKAEFGKLITNYKMTVACTTTKFFARFSFVFTYRNQKFRKTIIINNSGI